MSPPGGEGGPGGFDINQMLKNPQSMQIMLKLMSNPETKDMFSDPSFMGTLQMIMQNPSMMTALAQKDPRFKKIIDVINAPADPNMPDFANMFAGGPPGAGTGPKKSSKTE